MKIVLLGTAGYHPNDHRQTAGIMLPQLGVLLDAGTATYRVRDYLVTDTLDIFLSHAHLDHVIGLTYLFDVVHDKPVRRIVVHGRPETLQAVDEHLFAQALFPARPAMELRPLTAAVTLRDGALVLVSRAAPRSGCGLSNQLDTPFAGLCHRYDRLW
jgi:ribonuclease BN (tRNA processing enzyme)